MIWSGSRCEVGSRSRRLPRGNERSKSYIGLQLRSFVVQAALPDSGGKEPVFFDDVIRTRQDLYSFAIVAAPELHCPVMSTTCNPLGVLAHVHTQNVPRVSTKLFGQRPVVSRVYVDVLVKAAGDEKGSCFPRGDFSFLSIFHIDV